MKTISKHTPRRSGAGMRRVLIPGTNRAGRHPWSARIRAVLDGQPATKASKAADQ